MRMPMTIAAIHIVAFLLFTSPSQALSGGDVMKAKALIKAGNYPQAIELLNTRITDQPADAKAHLLLGQCYAHQGQWWQAEEQFYRAATLDPSLKSDVAREYRNMADKDLQANRLQRAETNYGKALGYDAGVADDAFLKQLGYRYLRTAVRSRGPTRESYQQRAEGLVGTAIVGKIFPESYQRMVINRSIPAAAADREGRLTLFIWGVDDLRTNDEIIVVARLKPDKQMTATVLAYPTSNPKGKDDGWVEAQGLEHRDTLLKTAFPAGTPFEILIDPEAVDSVELKTYRKTTPEPNLSLLNSLIK